MYLTLNHQNLEVYHLSMKMVQSCYRLTSILPPEERFGMNQQLKRAALSVHLNIAEASSRRSPAERKRFYEIARGSLIEIDAALDIANRLGYLDQATSSDLGIHMLSCFRLLTRMIQST